MLPLVLSTLSLLTVGSATDELRASLQGRPSVERIITAAQGVVAAKEPEGVMVMHEAYRSFAQVRQNWERQAAELLAKVEGQADKKDSRRGARRSSGSAATELQTAETQRLGFKEMQETLHSGLVELLVGIGGQGDRSIFETCLELYEKEHEFQVENEKKLVEVKGALAETLSRLRRAREAGRDKIFEQRASLEAFILRLEGEMDESEQIQGACFQSIRGLVRSLPKAESKEVVKDVNGKVGKRATLAEKMLYMDLVAGLGQEKTPELIEDVAKDAARDIKKQEAEVEKLRERYQQNLAGYFGQGNTGATRVRVRDALLSTQEELRQASAQVGELQRLRRAACLFAGCRGARHRGPEGPGLSGHVAAQDRVQGEGPRHPGVHDPRPRCLPPRCRAGQAARGPRRCGRVGTDPHRRPGCRHRDEGNGRHGLDPRNAAPSRELGGPGRRRARPHETARGRVDRRLDRIARYGRRTVQGGRPPRPPDHDGPEDRHECAAVEAVVVQGPGHLRLPRGSAEPSRGRGHPGRDPRIRRNDLLPASRPSPAASHSSSTCPSVWKSRPRIPPRHASRC